MLQAEPVTEAERREYALELAEERPRTRGDCAGGARPCPWVGCRYHLYLDVSPASGNIQINRPDLEPEDLDESCALDVADRGPLELVSVGRFLDVSRERIRQIETKGLEALKDVARECDFEEPVPFRETPLAAIMLPDSENVAELHRVAAVRRAHGGNEHEHYVPRGQLPPPPSRKLYRCSLCSVRVEESTLPEHAERHRAEGIALNIAFEPDDSVQKPVGRPGLIAMTRLIGRARRRANSTAEPTFENPPPLQPDERPAFVTPHRAPEARKETTVSNETMSVAEAAELLGCSASNVRQVAQRGGIKRAEVDGEWRYDRSSVEAWKARGTKGSKAEPKAKPERAERIRERVTKPKPRKPVKPPPKRVEVAPPPVSSPQDLAGVIRAFGLIVDLGKLEPADAFAALRELAA